MRVWLLVLSVAVILAGCGRIQPVEREQVVIGQGLSVQGSRVWNQFPTGTLGADAAWTQDGLPLDHVLFIAGRPDGEPLFERSRSRRSLQFRSNMTATEIAELWGTELALGERQQIEVGAPEPKVFAGHSGFHFGYQLCDGGRAGVRWLGHGSSGGWTAVLDRVFRHACAPLSGALAGGAASHPLGTGSGRSVVAEDWRLLAAAL